MLHTISKSTFLQLVLIICLIPSFTNGFCTLAPSSQEELGGSWVLDSFLSNLLCGNCSSPNLSTHQSEKKKEEATNDFATGSVIGFQQLLQPHSLMVTFSPVPKNILQAHSYWMCRALASPQAVLTSAGSLTIHLFSDSTSYQYVVSNTEEGGDTISFWPTQASQGSSALTSPLWKQGGRLYLGAPSLVRYLPLMRTAHTGLGDDGVVGHQEDTLPSPPSPAHMRAQVESTPFLILTISSQPSHLNHLINHELNSDGGCLLGFGRRSGRTGRFCGVGCLVGQRQPVATIVMFIKI